MVTGNRIHCMAKCLPVQFTVGANIFWGHAWLEKYHYHARKQSITPLGSISFSNISYHFLLVAEGHVTLLLLVSGESSVLMAAEPKPR